MPALLNKARYPDLSGGYRLYKNRSTATPKGRLLKEAEYNRVVKRYCKALADRMEKEGRADLPSGLGLLAAVSIRNKPVFDKREGKYRQARNIDWARTKTAGEKIYKDSPMTLGFVFVPRLQRKRGVLRCLGFVANKGLYRRVRKMYDEGTLPFYLADKEVYSI